MDSRTSRTDSVGTATFKRDGEGVTDNVLSDGSAAYTPGVSERRSGATRTYHLDRMGTVRRQSDSTQAVLNSRAYDAFGVLMGSAGTTSAPFGFVGAQGYQEDGDSGLMLLGHRYYDPVTGGFLTRDSAKHGRNWFKYCDNNPLKFEDGCGLAPGDPYDSPDAAGKAAIRDIYPQTYEDNKEHAGAIYQRADGKYSYTHNMDIRNDGHTSYPGVPPDKLPALGSWHTHAKGVKIDLPDEGIHTDGADNDFSPGDIERADNRKGVEDDLSYVGVPDGTIRRYHRKKTCFRVVPHGGENIVIGRWRVKE